MPFKSKAQMRMAEAAAADPNHPQHAYWKDHIEEWESATDGKALPDHVPPAKPKQTPKTKTPKTKTPTMRKPATARKARRPRVR